MFDPLGLCPQFPKYVDHLVNVAGIPAETIPLGEQHQFGITFALRKVNQKSLPLRVVKRLCRMILKDHLPDLDIMKTTILTEHFLLVTLRVTLIGLLIRAHTDI